MINRINFEDISDGKTYDINDLVRADAGGCEGCSACCHGVGDLFSLNPYDIYQIKKHLKVSFDELVDEKIELILENKFRLPHLKMYGEDKRCSFLNDENRCSIHEYRPDVCRLFPLGRVYEKRDFKYFLQKGACVKTKLGKVKIKKWLNIDNYSENKKFILMWHDMVKALEFRLKFARSDEEIEAVGKDLLDTFYRIDIPEDRDFYEVFFEIAIDAKPRLGII